MRLILHVSLEKKLDYSKLRTAAALICFNP
jgi:hypothetical protein